MVILAYTPSEARYKRMLIVLSSLLQQANRQCRIEGNPLLSLDDIPDIPQVCPILGLELQRSPYNHLIDESYWVDAIDPELGHVKDNLQIISYKAYKLRKKGESTKEVLR